MPKQQEPLSRPHSSLHCNAPLIGTIACRLPPGHDGDHWWRAGHAYVRWLCP